MAGLLRARRTAAVHGAAARRALGGVAQRRRGHQAARVDGEEGHVVADGGVDGGAQLRLVVDAGLADAAGEIDQRLLFGERAQHARRGFQRGQLAVGIEDVEFGVVGGVRRAGVFLVIGAGGAVDREIAAFADGQALDDLGQGVAIVGEILQHFQVAREGHDGHQVGRRHLRLEEFLGGGLGADLVLNRHAGHVEEHHQQAAVLVLHFAGLGGRNLVGGDRFHDGRRRGRRRVRRFAARARRLWQARVPERGGLFQFLEGEDLDVLLLAVFGDVEVGRLQTLDGVAALVLHGDIDHHQLGRGAEFDDALGRRGAASAQPVASAEAAPKLPAGRSRVWR